VKLQHKKTKPFKDTEWKGLQNLMNQVASDESEFEFNIKQKETESQAGLEDIATDKKAAKQDYEAKKR